nr:carboxypeptidase-like regulatory domain-containing protein [Variovorax sp. HW608]
MAQAQTPVLAPSMKALGAARYVCGGIGAEESSAMRAAMKDHPLSLLFARESGAYLADVQVTVTDAQGSTALSMRADGPVCLVDLPAGRYTVEAASEGVAKTQVVSLGNGSKVADFRF